MKYAKSSSDKRVLLPKLVQKPGRKPKSETTGHSPKKAESVDGERMKLLLWLYCVEYCHALHQHGGNS